MDWSEILKRGGVPEPPGRKEALDAAMERSRARALRKARPPAKRKSAKKPRKAS